MAKHDDSVPLLSIFIAFCLILNTVEIAFILFLSLLKLKSKSEGEARTTFLFSGLKQNLPPKKSEHVI